MTTLGSFIRDTAYFQIRRDQQLMLNAEDFDLQFTNLVNYINNKITPLVNRLENLSVPGTDEEGTANTFLRNIGDGNTEWVSINNEAVNNYSIAYSKLIGSISGSMFATANDRVFKVVSPTAENQILSSIGNNLPVWQKVKGDNFEDRTITGLNIGFACVGAEHLSPQIIGRPVNANSVLTRHVLDQSIPGSKFADSSITTTKIDAALVTERVNNINAGKWIFINNSLENRHFPNNFFSYLSCVVRSNTNQDDNTNYTFTPDHIVDNSISSVINQQVNTTRSFANGAIEPGHIILNSTTFNGVGSLGSPKIRKEKLNAAIRAKLGI